MQPSVHQSTGFPCPILKTISGARYSVVPHIVFASNFPLMFYRDSPKSVIRM